MATTLQKEYALIYYLHTVIGQTNNNGYLNELYSEKNLKSILETLINNKVKDKAGVDVEELIPAILRQVNTDVLTDPNHKSAKFNILPNNPVSALELYMGKIINTELTNSKQRIFVDDITDAKDGMAGYFVSLFTINDMISSQFEKMVTWDQDMSINGIRKKLVELYTNSNAAVIREFHVDVNKIIRPFAQTLFDNNFTNKDFAYIEEYIKAYYKGNVNEVSIENAITAAIKKKKESEGSDEQSVFELRREQQESNLKGKILSSTKISNFLDTSSDARFSGTMKYTRNGSLDGGESAERVIQIALSKQNRVDKENIDRFSRFVDVLNKLLNIETRRRGGDSPPIPPVRTGTYRAGRTKVIKTILLTEEQYHVLFPEYFITVGLINEKVSTASQLSGTQMKSGDEVTNVVDSYTGENKYEYDDDESFSSTELTVDKTPKLVIAKMLAIINGHPESVPDTLTPTKMPNSTIYEVNRLLVRELCNTPYTYLREIGFFIESGQLPEELKPNLKALSNLRMTYLATCQEEHQQQAERDIHVKAHANILSELAQLANLDVKGKSMERNTNDIILKGNGCTFILNNLPEIVNMMISRTMKGEFIASMTCNDAKISQSAIDFLSKANLLKKVSATEYAIIPNIQDIQEIVDNLDWAALDTYHDRMLSTALNNCGYVYRLNGWTEMTEQERHHYKFSFVTEAPKTKDVDYDKTKLVDLFDHILNLIKPYMLKIRDTNRVIHLIESTCRGITGLPEVQAPVVNDDTMDVADGMLNMFGTDNSAEEANKLAEEYYTKYVIPQYEEAVSNACKAVHKKLSDHNMLTEITQRKLIQSCNHNGSLTKIVNEIFAGPKQAVYSNTASNYIQQEVRDIFTIAEAIISLYTTTRNSVCQSDPTIGNSFRDRQYITINEVKQMANGTTPNGKKYTEDGSDCPKDFLLNAYLIDILFETIYLLMVQFNLPAQTQYTVQNVLAMKNVTEMKRYINSNLDVKLRDKVHDNGLITKIINRKNVLFTSHMVTMLSGLIVKHPDVSQLTTGEYSKINGQTTHMTSEKTLSNEIANIAKPIDADIQDRKREERIRRFFGRH